MKQFISIAALILSAALVPSCSKKDSVVPNAPRATVFLRDGTSYAGTVKSTSSTEITLAGDDNNSRTFDMKNVKSIEYGEAAAAQTPTPQGEAPAPAALKAPAPKAPTPKPTVAERPRPVRDHPDESVVNTRTNVLPVGTEVAVRTDETIDSGKAVEGQTFAVNSGYASQTM